MKSGYSALALAILLAGSPLLAQQADTVFLSENIITSNPELPLAQSVAVAGNSIICVRTDDSCRELAGDGTQIVDAGTNTVMAGIIDTHLHTRIFGQTHFVMLNLFGYNDASREEVVEVIREYAATLGPDEWVIGGGWSDAHFQNPTKEELDEIVGGRPALISDNTQHNGWYSTKALEYLGITADWEPPKGGYMPLNDAGDEPSGLLQEKAHLSTGFVEQHKLYSFEKQEEAIIGAARVLNAVGVTGATEAAAGSKEGADDVYVRLAQKGELTLRHELAMVFWGTGTPEGDTAMIEQLEIRRAAVEDAGVDPSILHANTVKFAIDGTPGRFAYMEGPYLDGTRPDMNFRPDNLAEIFDALTERDFTLMLHVEGNAGIRRSLDALEFAHETGEPLRDDIPQIFTHVDHLSIDNARRMSRLGVSGQLQLHWADPTEEYFRNVTSQNLPKEVLERMYQFKLVTEFMEYGFGPDAPTSPVFSPWEGMEIGMTRQAMGTPGGLVMPGEPLTFEEVIHGSTLGSARLQDRGDVLGSLEEGKIADIIVLDRDIRRQAEENVFEFHKTEVLQTYFGGELVYDIDRDGEPDKLLTEPEWEEGDDEKLRRGVAVTSVRVSEG
ncbi:amidohydrolase [Ruegeria sp. HKCCA5426]|uniref:amidohydrolase n=1 Tax=Ruegeria sp. HKCCA5426 TaxID=2682985 RepID=UPI0020C44EF0|nr:amidohydrolase family protein [Ruegeria sp. HKCCA5426]